MQDGHTRRAWLQAGAAACASALLPTARANPAQPWPPRQAAPAFTALDLAGASWSLEALRGRAVLLNFWASWCEPCRSEMPTLQQLADLYGNDKLAVLALNFKEAPATATRFVRNTGLGLPVLLDSQGEIAKRWAVKIFPSTIGVARDGRPRWRVTGEMDWTSAEAGRLVEGLMAP